MQINPLNRRQFLQTVAIGTGALGLSACGFNTRSTASQQATASFAPDLELALTATRGDASILPGAATRVLTYAADVMTGDPNAVTTLDGYLGPILRVRRGQKVRVNFNSKLDEESIIHWHGLILPERMDGHPRDAIGAGESYVYEFTVRNRAGTYWFHPHPHGATGSQVYHGLAGLFLVSDEEEEAVELPAGEFDVPLVLQDRTLDERNQLVYQGGGSGGMMGGGMMSNMMGMFGDRILVNGQVNAALDVDSQRYRLRLLNGSNARIYRLAWEDQTPLMVIATDGGLLEQPVEKPFVTLAPGQRIELLVDFAQWGSANSPRLVSLPTPQSGAFPILAVNVAANANSPETAQNRTSSYPSIERLAVQDATSEHSFSLGMQRMSWAINGRTYSANRVANTERMTLGKTAIWEFVNDGSGGGMMGGMMALPHPMHIHGVQFQVVGRQIGRSEWTDLHAGYVDSGWLDTVLVTPGERVKVIMRFTEPGTFVYHCHNLEHEDMGMMRNFSVA